MLSTGREGRLNPHESAEKARGKCGEEEKPPDEEPPEKEEPPAKGSGGDEGAGAEEEPPGCSA